MGGIGKIFARWGDPQSPQEKTLGLYAGGYVNHPCMLLYARKTHFNRSLIHPLTYTNSQFYILFIIPSKITFDIKIALHIHKLLQFFIVSRIPHCEFTSCSQLLPIGNPTRNKNCLFTRSPMWPPLMASSTEF